MSLATVGEFTFRNKNIKSNQINFVYIAQSHNHIASMGFTICTVNNILCPQTLNSSEEKCHMLKKKRIDTASILQSQLNIQLLWQYCFDESDNFTGDLILTNILLHYKLLMN